MDFLLKSTLSLGLLYSVYILLLEKEKMPYFNRFYLLFGLLFSLLIPFFTFEIPVERTAVAVQNTIQALPVSTVILEEKTTYIPFILWSVYALVSIALLSRFVLNLITIEQKIKTNATQKIQNATLVLLNENVLPHTFLSYIFINKENFENKKIEGELFSHELTHVQQKHTLDILFIEILKTIFWFNPILILYKKAIQLNHEFLADENVVRSHNNVPYYQSLLLQKGNGTQTIYLASNLNFLVTKKRLIMMTKTTSSKTIFLKKIAILPVSTLLIYFLCFETVAQQRNQTSTNQSEKSKVSDDVKLDDYFAGVRFKVYKKGSNRKTAVIGEDLILDKLYEELTTEDKAKFKTWLTVPNAIVKKSPTKKEFEDYKDSKKYAIWIDNKNVPNSELNKYTPEEIAYFSGSAVFKNARTKKHPQPFQFWFFTHSYFDKNNMGKKPTKYPGDKVELFIDYEKEIAVEKAPRLDKEVAIPKDQEPKSDIYLAVEKRPEFQGGIQKFYDFVGQNYKMPDVKDLKGRVFIQFVVEKDGSLTNFKVLRDIGHGTGEEAVRVLKLSPKWIPGEENGKKVRVLYSLPISIQGN
jgi:hypothetical protein